MPFYIYFDKPSIFMELIISTDHRDVYFSIRHTMALLSAHRTWITLIFISYNCDFLFLRIVFPFLYNFTDLSTSDSCFHSSKFLQFPKSSLYTMRLLTR
jgi:hypothetical protein